MGSRYLTDLASVVRAAGITVQEEPGWATRARSSGGYNSELPNHVMAHHTASNPSSDGQADVNYCCYGSENRPVANLYLSRSGKVWVMAAGATNTNGQGHDPCGATNDDSMNSAAIGIEAANTGTGETWPTAQQDVYLRLVKALCDRYGIPNGRIHAHSEWAPDRKIDPAGQSRYASGGAKWNMAAFRSDVANTGGGGEPLPPPGRKKLMYAIIQDELGACWATNMIECRYLYSTTLITIFKNMLTVFGYGTTPTKVKSADVKAGGYGVIKGGVPSAYGTDALLPQQDTWGLTLPQYGAVGAARADLALQDVRARVIAIQQATT
jgi:hypothetical protein